MGRRGHALTRTTTQLPDISQVQASGGINIRASIVAELELRHHLEREVCCAVALCDLCILLYFVVSSFLCVCAHPYATCT